jgi:transposase
MWTRVMIVLGADTHKRSHTLAAINVATGQVLGDKTVQVGPRGFATLLGWARGLDGQRVWALEDCRHVSGALERFLLGRGERVVRVSTRLMAASRRSSRQRGKSDQIDAVSVARAALAAGIETLPTAALAGVELDIRLLVDHRERLVRTRVALNSTLQWNLHDLWPELALPGGALFSKKWTSKIARRLARAEQTMRVRIARDELRRVRELTHTINALEIEIAGLVAQVAPQLVAERGCGPLTAAKLVGEIAGADRFATDAKLARAAGIAPVPASSGRADRHRLDRCGNRQINAAIHRMAVTRARCDPQTRDYIARKKAEGKTNRDAIRCLKRHLARRAWQLLRAPPRPGDDPHHQFLDIGAAKEKYFWRVVDAVVLASGDTPSCLVLGSRAAQARRFRLTVKQHLAQLWSVAPRELPQNRGRQRLTRPRRDKIARPKKSGPARRKTICMTSPPAVSLAVGARNRLTLLSTANSNARP